jgi:hypothetical protein
VTLPSLVLIAVGVALAHHGATPDARAAGTKRPNIVFVLTDDLSWNLVQYMPNVQAM